MTDQTGQEKETKKGIFARFIDKLDKKMKEASEKKSCCCSSNKEKDASCS